MTTPTNRKEIRDLTSHVQRISKLISQAEKNIIKRGKIEDLTDVLAQLIKDLNGNLKGPKLLK